MPRRGAASTSRRKIFTTKVYIHPIFTKLFHFLSTPHYFSFRKKNYICNKAPYHGISHFILPFRVSHIPQRTYSRAEERRPAPSVHLGRCRKSGCKLICVNSTTDHVHLAVGLKADISVADFMRDIKGATSRWISSHPLLFPSFMGWGEEYFGCTFSVRDLPNVVSYISNQQEHHHNKSLEDEMIYFFSLTNQQDRLQYFLSKR